jgi:hypothetical protein
MGWSPTWSPSRHSTSIETSLSRWVSRHGAFTVHFDPDGRVAWKTTGEAKVVPPWQRCWRFLTGKL